MGELKIYDVANTTIAKRNIIVSPPEPPAEYLMGDPTNSIYIGRTEIFNVPFHWTFQRLVNPHIAIVGTTGSGKSISYDEEVLVKQNGKPRLVKIGELVDSLIRENGSEFIEDCEGVSDPNIEVYTFDENLKSKWSKVRFAGRKISPKYMYKFTTASKREIITTGDHNLVIIKNGEIKVMKSSEVNVGDYIPIPRKIKINDGFVSEINLIELLKDEKVYITGASKILESNYQLIKNFLPIDKKYDKYLKFYTNGRRIPISYFLKLLKCLNISDDEFRSIKIIEKKSKEDKAIPIFLPLTKEMMRLLGYIASEGRIQNTCVKISNKNEEILTDIYNCAKIFNPKLNKRRSKSELVIYSKLFVKILKSLGLYGNSEKKRAPWILFHVNEILLSEYFRAYYEGDGCVEKRCITATTKSKNLANDHLYHLLRLGIIGRIEVKKLKNTKYRSIYYQITISGRENLEKFAQIGFVSQEKNLKLFKLLQGKSSTNVDIIPEVGQVVKRIHEAINFDKSKMEDSIIRGIRRPSRKYLKKLISKIKDRVKEIKSIGKEIEQLRNLSKLCNLVQIAEERNFNSILYKEMDESWRRAKRRTVRTKLRNVNKIAEIIGEHYLQKEQLRNCIRTAFSILGIGLQSFDKSVYDFCTGRREDITYEKIEKTSQFLVQKYDEVCKNLCLVEKDIEFIEILANSDILWDPIISIEKLESKHKYVYDLCVDDQVFLAGFGGIFVHNSYFIKTFLLRASLVWNANAIIIDWAGEYKPWVRQVGGKVVALARGAYLNLLDLAGMKPSDRIKQVIRSLEILTDIGEYPEQRRLIEQAMEEAYIRKGFKLTEKDQRDALGRPLTPPTLKDVQKILQEKLETGTYEFPAELENAIYKLKRFTLEGDDYFAEQSTIKLDELLSAGLVDIDLSGLPDETFRALGALTILQFVKEKMRMEGWSPEKGIKLFVVVDEAWKISKDENSDLVMIVREGRKYQFALIVASQSPMDIAEAVFSNVGTVFMLRLKFEKFLDYLQGSLRFSDYIRQKILSFGVGQCAVSMSYAESVPFSECFIVKKIEGEEPIIDYFVDIHSVLTELQLRDETMPKSFPKEKVEFKKRLREMGLTDEKIEEIARMIEKKARHIDAVDLVIELERRGVDRAAITSFYRELGIDDPTIINIFAAADKKRAGGEVTHVTIE